MSKDSDRIIVHEADELWEIDSIIRDDFPKLKAAGYDYAIIFESMDCECFVYGHKQRWRAVREADQYKGSCHAYVTRNGDRIY